MRVENFIQQIERKIMASDSVIYLCINLPWAEERRNSITAQAERVGIEVQFVEAIAGKDLPAEVPEYHREERAKLYPKDMTVNEIACVLSHMKAMRTFLESGAKYGVVLEDDALLAENFAAGIREVTQHLSGWEMAKLNTDDNSKLYPIGDEGGELTRAVFPKKLLWVAVGWLYTRRGAERMLEALQTFTLPADVQIGHYILSRRIPTIGISPSLVTTSDPQSLKSTIGTAECPRITPRVRRTPLQFIRYKLSIWRVSLGKQSMRRLLRRCIRRS